MITYKDVAADVLAYSLPGIKKIIEEHDLKSVQDLINFLVYSKSYDEHFDESLSSIRHDMCIANRKGKEPNVYSTKEYEDKSLNNVDKYNYGDILLLSAPTGELSTRYRSLRDLSIDKIKKYLTLTDASGDNYLLRRAKNLGVNSVDNLISSIDMYSNQVVRQALLTDSKEKNIFTYQQSEKAWLVKEKYADIIAYLIYNTDELVWGKLSDTQKKLYLSSIIGSKKLDVLIKERMIDIIANYTTLPELEDVKDNNYDVLKRFIKR